MTFDGLQPDTLTPLVRRLNQSMLSLAALGGALRLHESGGRAPAAVADALDATLVALGAPAVAGLSPDEATQALGLIRTFFAEARDLLDTPERPPGWAFEDPAILQGIGSSSAGMIDRMTRLGEDRAWLGAILRRGGVLLDVGTGVGGLALAAAAAWSGMRVLGIDVWTPSLALAERNRAAMPYGDRVRFEHRSLQSIDETAAFDAIWLPTPFIDGAVVAATLPQLLRALVPGGAMIVGVLPAPEEPLGQALSRLRTIRNGGHPWSCAEMEALLTEAGFEAVETPHGQSGMHFVLGRRPG